MENWQAIEWPICLAEPPVLAQMSAGLHGVHEIQDRFQLPTLWSLHFYRYRATLELGGQLFPIRPGFVGLTPPNQPVLYRYEGPSPHLYAHFRLPPGTTTSMVPLMQDLGERFPALYVQFEEVALAPQLPRWRRQARLWEVLCQLTERPIPALRTAGHHAAVAATIERIEQRLGEPLSIAQLAREAGVSYSYLGRLFQQQIGMSAIGYLRQRRIERAAHLLKESTLPIKSVAIAVGIPDLHLFNKTIRAALGASPRAIRIAREKEPEGAEK
jgi:AraC family transcriptional regulator